MRRMLGATAMVTLAVLICSVVAGAAGGIGTRANPYKMRTLVALPGSKGWKLRVNKVIPNGTSLVMAENQFNDPPKPGRQFFIINVTLIYTGTKSTSPFGDVTLYAVGKSNVAYGTDLSDYCGVIPDKLDDFAKVFPGGRITGNICFSVRKPDAARLLLYYEPSFSLDDVQVFFKLRP